MVYVFQMFFPWDRRSQGTFPAVWGGSSCINDRTSSLSVDYLHATILHHRFDHFPMDSPRKTSRLPPGFKLQGWTPRGMPSPLESKPIVLGLPSLEEHLEPELVVYWREGSTSHVFSRRHVTELSLSAIALQG